MVAWIKEILLYSDTCDGQKRNENVAAIFMYAIQTLKFKVITHNFLESGHSQMEFNSMYSSIERKKKRVDEY